MVTRTRPFDQFVASHLGMIRQLVAFRWALMHSAVEFRTTWKGLAWLDPENKENNTYHESGQPPSGHSVSNSPLVRRMAVRLGCCSHLTGSPSYKWWLAFRCSINGTQVSFPFLLLMNVFEFPIIINTSRARDKRTFKRWGAAINPISPALLLRVSETMTISLSSP